MLNVLLSAYACEPGKGSEPGVGWAWAKGLAGRVNLTVLTRSNNRPALEAALGELEDGHPLKKVRFLYEDLPGVFLQAKRLGFLSTGIYYLIWQFSVTRKLAKQRKDFDIIHHLTFCTPLSSGFWSKSEAKKVIGPVGAPVVNEDYLGLFGRTKFVQRIRNWVFQHLGLFPWIKRSMCEADVVFPANSEAKELLEPVAGKGLEVMLDTGAPLVPEEDIGRSGDRGMFRFLYAGVVERRKGLELVLRSFAKVLRSLEGRDIRPPALTILGKGPDLDRQVSLAKDLHISKSVDFLGRVSQEEVNRHFRESDVFVFVSVRDTSGGVNLEAMAHGLPILCIAHQGVGDITDHSCSIRVQPSGVEETIEALAAGMEKLVLDSDLRRSLGKNARLRARSVFSWNLKFDRMIDTYHSLVDRK